MPFCANDKRKYNRHVLLVDGIKRKRDEDISVIKTRLLKTLHIREKELISYKIDKVSLDARRDIEYIYRLKVNVKDEMRLINDKNVHLYKRYEKIKKVKSALRPIVIGDGPSGMFCAYTLLEAGLRPLVFEKGKDVDERSKDVASFLNDGILIRTSNVQFGEGGAGTFSDAKLTTRIKDPYIEFISETFVKYGASDDILIESHPHIGSDKIIEIMRKMRKDMIEKGTSFHFEEAVKDIIIKDDRIVGVKTDKDIYHSDYIILAIGHSAIDSFKMLIDKGVYTERKDIAVGFRVEHPQDLIDDNQYNGHKIDRHAEYFLRYRANDRGVYSFCMCPGGYIIPSSAEPNTICTNGMSFSKRDNQYANSAILCQLFTSDTGDDLYSSYRYLDNLEKKAYALSNSYRAPSQNIKDYLAGRVSPLIFSSTYALGTYEYDLNAFFDDQLNDAFKKALINFDHKIKGFIANGIMVAPETRSSSPFRVKRGQDMQSVSHRGLYPIGEGAGYAGGIMSSALDGVKCALKIIETIAEHY